VRRHRDVDRPAGSAEVPRLKIQEPEIGVCYDFAETGAPTLSGLGDAFLDRLPQAPMTT
jgi:hypothetical protein